MKLEIPRGFAAWNWTLGREGRTDISIIFLVETSQLDGAVWTHVIRQGGGVEPPCSLVNSKSGPTLADKQKELCVSLRSYGNEVTLEYILCGCLYFVNSLTNMACLIFQKMCVLGAKKSIKWYLILKQPM